MMKQYLMFFYVLPVGFSHAFGFVDGSLLRECSTGSPMRIERVCTQRVQNEFKQPASLDDSGVLSLLQGKELRQACYTARLMRILAGAKVSDMPEMKDVAFVTWFLQHPEIAEDMVFSRRMGKQSMKVLYQLWNQEGKNPSLLLQNLMVGAALANDKLELDMCVKTYDFFKKSYEEGKLFPQFETLKPWEYALLFCGQGSLDDLAWGQNYLQTRPKIKAENAGSSCNLIPYRKRNRKGVDVQKGAAFYDHKPQTLALYVEYGGVCGALSTAGSMFVRSKGIPSYTFGQPGHCAFLWKKPDGRWDVGNNVFGWIWSFRKPDIIIPWEGEVSIVNTIVDFEAGEHAEESALAHQLYLLLGNSELSQRLLSSAISLNKKNYGAWWSYLELKNKDLKGGDRVALAYQLKEAMGEDVFAIRYLLRNVFRLTEKDMPGYAQISLYLLPEETRTSQAMYLEAFSLLAQEDVPELKELIAYNSKTRAGYYKNFVDAITEHPPKKATGRRLVKSLLNALQYQLDYPQMYQPFSTFCGDVLVALDDKGASTNAKTFIEALLPTVEKPEAKAALQALLSRLGQDE